MSGVRAPLFAGVTGRVGTSTLAAALHGVDTGRYAGGPVDVLVCGPGSLATAARLSGPVLAVVAERPPRLDRPAAGFGAVVTVPEIAAWRALDMPDVAGLLGMAPPRLPPRLRPYADALLEITAALLRSGVLERPARPVRPSFSPAVMARPVEIGRRRPTPVPALAARAPVIPVPAGRAPTAGAPIIAAPTTGAAANPAAVRAAVARIAAASVAPAPPAPAPGSPAGATPAVDAPGDPTPADGPAGVIRPARGQPDPAGPAAVRPAATPPGVVGGTEVPGPAGNVARPLWRGLQAVERAPVLPRAPAPVPMARRDRPDPAPVTGRAELDDDTLESMRVG